MYPKASLAKDPFSQSMLTTVAAESVRKGKATGNDAVAPVIYRVAESLKAQSELADRLECKLPKAKKKAKRG